jgi:hypothetical protein
MFFYDITNISHLLHHLLYYFLYPSVDENEMYECTKINNFVNDIVYEILL